jgi:glycosyltransferase involved in cell wall biosynthesis
MNILFVNYGPVTNNSTPHLAGFALAAKRAGHDVVMAALKGDGEWPLGDGQFIKLTSLGSPELLWRLFADRRPPDVIHACSPRERVRHYVFACLRYAPHAAVALHLEDNYDALAERQFGKPLAEITAAEVQDMFARVGVGHACPLRWRPFAQLADRISVIYDSLGELAQDCPPWETLPPIMDFAAYAGASIDHALRREMGVPDGAYVVTYTGNDHYANREDMRQLYTVVHALNESGMKVQLLRAGKAESETTRPLPFDYKVFTTEVGFVPRATLEGKRYEMEPALIELMAQADLFIQPGGDDAFNRYRLPAKVPEYLAMGKPVLMARSNVGNEMVHGEEAWLTDGSTTAMIESARTLLLHPALRSRIGEGGYQFAQRRFSLKNMAATVVGFYDRTVAAARERVGVRGMVSPGFRSLFLENEATPNEALVGFLQDELARTRTELERVKSSHSKATDHKKRLGEIRGSWAWRVVGRPLHSLERKLRKPSMA